MRTFARLDDIYKTFTIFSVLLILGLFVSSAVKAGVIEDTFSKFSAQSTKTVDHSSWDALLGMYVFEGFDGVNRVNYKKFKAEAAGKLKAYLAKLEGTDVSSLNKNEQFAFWVNLYNAKTIDVILDHYPTASIKDIDISPGLFADGPWGKKNMKVKGIVLSLDDVEHKILRGLWKDPRVHYAVNCASIGCPNLAVKAFTGAKLQAMLNENSRIYINSARGVRVKDGRVTASKIFSWFRKDFGTSEENILKHVRQYASDKLKKQLKGITSIYSYEYDWSLNDLKK